MDFCISGKNYELNDDIKKFIRSKCERIEKLQPFVSKVSFSVSKEKSRYVIHVHTTSLKKSDNFHEEGIELKKAIATLIDRVFAVLSKEHKIFNHKDHETVRGREG